MLKNALKCVKNRNYGPFEPEVDFAIKYFVGLTS